MQRMTLGQTGLTIHPLVFGTLPLGPLQADLPPEEGGALIRYALERGVNLIDTADLYGSFAHIREGLRGYAGDALVASKTHASDAATARRQIERALDELGLAHLDIVHLHGARIADPFVERAEVIEELLKMKEEGLIGHIGLSSHYICAIRKSIEHPEIEVLHPLINRTGRGLLDGSAEEMAAAIAAAAEAGKGIYAMKALAGGNLISTARESLGYVRDLPGVHALALGMLSRNEVDANMAFMEKAPLDVGTWETLEQRTRRLQIMTPFCNGCGHCAEACTEGGLKIVDGKATVEADACVLCGYCAAACPQFIIRVV